MWSRIGLYRNYMYSQALYFLLQLIKIHQSNKLPWPQQVKWLQKGSSLQSWGSCSSETIWHNPRTFSLFLPFSKGRETFWRVSLPTCLSDLLIDLLKKYLNTWKMALAENRTVNAAEWCNYFWNWCYMTGENTEKVSGSCLLQKHKTYNNQNALR